MNFSLVTFKKSGQRRDLKLADGIYTIGRKPDAHIRIPSAAVSRNHCQLTVGEGMAIIRDLGSSNGTQVNKKSVNEAELNAGDQIKVGPITFTVQIDGRPANINPVPPEPRKKLQAKAPPKKDLDADDDLDLGDLSDLDLDDLSDLDLDEININTDAEEQAIEFINPEDKSDEDLRV